MKEIYFSRHYEKEIKEKEKGQSRISLGSAKAIQIGVD